MADDMSLEGKIILITGGGSGIGFALAHQALTAGAKVLIADLKLTPPAKQLVDENENVVFQRCDVTKWNELNTLFATSEQTWNEVPDAYGLCAGLFEPPFSNFWEDVEDERYAQVDVNVVHPIKLTRLAIRHSLRKKKKASVCITASLAGLVGYAALPLYSATKHAIVGFVKSMKDTEPMTGVKVTAICPHLVNTPLMTPEKREQFSIPDEEGSLTPDAVAEVILQLILRRQSTCGTVLEMSLSGQKVHFEGRTIADLDDEQKPQGVTEEVFITRMFAPILRRLANDRDL